MRAQVLCQVLTEGVLAKGQSQHAVELTMLGGARRFVLWRFWRWLRMDDHQRLLDCALSGNNHVDTACHAARLIIRLARGAPDACTREDYWNTAIGILDKLCDVGAPVRRAPSVPSERLEQLEDAPRAHHGVSKREDSVIPLCLLH
jgi:hypothetical protein